VTKRVISMHLKGATLLGALSELAVKEGIPIGLELSKWESYERRFDLDANAVTVGELLELIVHEAPNYRWLVRDGVVNVEPTGSRDPLFERLLNTRVVKFALKGGAGKFEIRNSVLELPEIQALIKTNDIKVSRLAYTYSRSIYSRDDNDLSVRDSDLRGILNAIIRSSEHNMWVLHWIGRGDELELAF